jgi:arginine decarboxylase-like protein
MLTASPIISACFSLALSRCDGDYHNLFGHVHDVFVVVDGKGNCLITKIVPGHKIEGVLKVFGYERDELMSEFRSRVGEGITREGLRADMGNSMMREFEAALGSYTYLTLD